MNQHTIVLLSRNPVDYLFAEQVSKNLGGRFVHADTKDRLHEVLRANPACYLLWDYDSVLEKRSEDAKLNADLMQYFEKQRIWYRIFAISSHPFRDTVVPGNFHLFAKYLLRNFSLEATRVYTYVIHNTMLMNPFETKNAGIDDLQIQKTRITSAAGKKSAIQALGTLLEKKTLPKRIATSLIQSTDELILNAVFDAPINMKGERYRHALNRGTDFELNKNEVVELEMITSQSFLQISVTDTFGSLEKESCISMIAKNFMKQGGPGLGLYQVLNSGLSMQIIIESGKRTRVSLFAPWVGNVRDLRDAFRFFTLRMKAV